MPLVTGGEDFVERESRHGFAKLFEFREGFCDFFPPPFGLWDEPCDRAAMPRDDDGLPAFDVIEELRQMRLGLGGLNFTHESVFHIDWST